MYNKITNIMRKAFMCFVALLAIAAAATGPAWGQNASTHTVTFAEGTEDVGNWSFTPEAATNTGVTEGTVVTVKYNGTSRINSIELKSKMLTTPLTIEALTAGTIVVQNPQSGMKYTLNSGTKTAITDNPTEITVAAGFRNPNYMKGVFRRKVGLSMREWRRQNTGFRN